MESLTVQEVCSHEQLQGDLWGNGELGDLGGAVGEPHFVGEVHANLLQHMRGNLSEINFVRFVLRELAWARQHSLDSSTGQSVLSLHDELVAITRDELHEPAANNGMRWNEL